MSEAKLIPPRKDDTNVKQGHHKDSMSWGAILLFAFVYVVLAYGCWSVSQYIDNKRAMAEVAPPKLFIRLIGVEGLDPRASSQAPPVFHLTVDVKEVSRFYHACSGGGNSMLRILYHDMILAWGHVPLFCIDGRRQSADGVATVEAKADGAVLMEEVRNLIHSEMHVVRKVEFRAEGEVTGLGYLGCKVFLFGVNATGDSKGMCQVGYY